MRPAHPRSKWVSGIAIVTSSIIVGGLLGYSLFHFRTARQYTKWTPVPGPPVRVDSINRVDPFLVIVADATGSLWVCNHIRPSTDCWHEILSLTPTPPSPVTRPCPTRGPPRPPQGGSPVVGAANCSLPDSFGETYYSVDEDGRLWEWSWGQGGYYAWLFPIMSTACGAAAMGFISFMFVIAKAITSRRQRIPRRGDAS